jgi:hypothetical protein
MTQRARPPRSHGHHTNQLHGQRRKSGIRHQSSMQKVTPGQAVSFVPQHTTRQSSKEPVMPFASPPSSSWQLSCLLLQLHFVPPFSSNASNRCPCFGSPAASVRSPDTVKMIMNLKVCPIGIIARRPNVLFLAGFLRTRKTARRKE